MPAFRGREKKVCVRQVCVGLVCVGLVREIVIAVLVCVGWGGGVSVAVLRRGEGYPYLTLVIHCRILILVGITMSSPTGRIPTTTRKVPNVPHYTRPTRSNDCASSIRNTRNHISRCQRSAYSLRSGVPQGMARQQGR